MKKYAIFDIKGTQHKAIEGEEIFIDKLTDKKLDPNILLVSDGKKVEVGKPYVKNAKIKLKVLEEEVKGKKLYVRKFKSKSRYRKKIGFRPVYSKVLVEKIS